MTSDESERTPDASAVTYLSERFSQRYYSMESLHSKAAKQKNWILLSRSFMTVNKRSASPKRRGQHAPAVTRYLYACLRMTYLQLYDFFRGTVAVLEFIHMTVCEPRRGESQEVTPWALCWWTSLAERAVRDIRSSPFVGLNSKLQSARLPAPDIHHLSAEHYTICSV